MRMKGLCEAWALRLQRGQRCDDATTSPKASNVQPRQAATAILDCIGTNTHRDDPITEKMIPMCNHVMVRLKCMYSCSIEKAACINRTKDFTA